MPGFHDGGTSMPVGEGGAEMVTGRPWMALDRGGLLRGLGRTSLAFDAPGTAVAPRTAVGETARCDDDARFLPCSQEGGVRPGATRAPTARCRSHSATRSVACRSPGLRRPRRCATDSVAAGTPRHAHRSLPRALSSGAFGSSPWIDLESGYGGVQ